MSTGDLDKLKGIFDRFDRDRSGAIDASELGRLLEAFASGTGERLLAALARLDTAHPDRVTWDEFRTWWTEVVSAQHGAAKKAAKKPTARRSAPVRAAADPDRSESDLREIFARFDRNKNGTIEARELATLLEALGRDPDDDDIRALFARFDTDKNGTISLDELAAWWEEES